MDARIVDGRKIARVTDDGKLKVLVHGRDGDDLVPVKVSEDGYLMLATDVTVEGVTVDLGTVELNQGAPGQNPWPVTLSGKIAYEPQRKRPATKLEFEYISGRYMTVLAKSYENGVSYGIDHGWMAKTTDGWETKTNSTVRPAGVANMVVWPDGSVCYIHMSGRITMAPDISTEPTDVLQADDEFHRLSVNFHCDGLNRYVIAGEYSQNTKDKAKKLYLSKDGGQTFDVIKVGDVLGAVNNHWHGVCYDPYAGAIWAAQGDEGNAKIYYSLDLGVSWNEVVKEPDAPGFLQPTLIHAFPDKVIFGRDSIQIPPGLDAFYREGADQFSDVALTPVLEFRKDTWSYQYYPAVAMSAVLGAIEAYIGFPRKVEGQVMSYIYATGDCGDTWHLVYAGQAEIYPLGTDGNYVFFGSHVPAYDSLYRAKPLEWEDF